MKIFHKIFQDKLITFFEMTDSFTDNFTDSIWSIIDQSGAKANNMLVGEILDEYVINHAVLDEFYLNTFNEKISLDPMRLGVQRSPCLRRSLRERRVQRILHRV